MSKVESKCRELARESYTCLESAHMESILGGGTEADQKAKVRSILQHLCGTDCFATGGGVYTPVRFCSALWEKKKRHTVPEVGIDIQNKLTVMAKMLYAIALES